MLRPSHALRFQSTLWRQAKPPPTHFTSTSPHAFSPLHPKSSINHATTIAVGPSPRAGESPRERVERLRSAARRAKLAEMPWQDRWIEGGRTVADRVHRSFVVFLVGASVLVGGFTAFALGDMFLHNRMKRGEWSKARQKRNEETLYTAIKAVHEGTADVKQKILIKRYEMVKDAEEKRLQSRGIIGKTIDWILPGISGIQSEARLVMKLDADIVKLLQSGQIDKYLEEQASTVSEANLSAPLDTITQSLPGREG